jgi:hypothetical protein
MPKTTEEARAGILDAITSDDPIAGLMPDKATNDFRLAVREALSKSRAQRLGAGYTSAVARRTVPTPGYKEGARGPEAGFVDENSSVTSNTTPNAIDNTGLLTGENDIPNTVNELVPRGDESFQEFWQSHFDTYNASEVDKLFGQKDIGSLNALEALEKLPWLGRALGWLSGVPILGGLIGKKGGEWVMNKFINEKVWMSPTDPLNPYDQSNADHRLDPNRLSDDPALDPLRDILNPYQGLPQNGDFDPNVPFDYLGLGTSNDAAYRVTDFDPNRSGNTPLLGEEGGMPGAVQQSGRGSVSNPGGFRSGSSSAGRFWGGGLRASRIKT